MTHNNKKKLTAPHKIIVEGKFGTEIYKDRLRRDDEINRKQALMAESVSLADEGAQIKGVAGLLNQLSGDLVINHPKNALKFVINKHMDASQCYLLSCGDYIPNMLDAIWEYLPEGAKTADIGAGIGVSTIVAAQVSGRPVLAVEPNDRLHKTIHQNADVNKAEISLIKGCVVAAEYSGDTDFFVSSQPWTSSIFAEKHLDIIEKVKMPIIDLEKLITEHEVNSLLLDIQGAELGLFDNIDLSKITCLIITIASKMIGERATASVINAITKQGLELKDIKGWTFVFQR